MGEPGHVRNAIDIRDCYAELHRDNALIGTHSGAGDPRHPKYITSSPLLLRGTLPHHDFPSPNIAPTHTKIRADDILRLVFRRRLHRESPDPRWRFATQSELQYHNIAAFLACYTKRWSESPGGPSPQAVVSALASHPATMASAMGTARPMVALIASRSSYFSFASVGGTTSHGPEAGLVERFCTRPSRQDGAVSTYTPPTSGTPDASMPLASTAAFAVVK
ncbi:hypothetical protein EI94DRAFT_1791538 [Lactarius quietus]|nr:hypothetical protein EI94DRAFT_1791538 [Lactarius quietus]